MALNKTYMSGKDWAAITHRAKSLWQEKVLGPRPNRTTIKQEISARFEINLLEWLSVLLLLVLALHTTIKVSALSVPFSRSVLTYLTGNLPIAGWVQDLFTVATMLLFSLLATPGLIYFQLLRDEPEIRRQQQQTALPTVRGSWKSAFGPRIKHALSALSLDYLTPRLPTIIVWVITLWLIYVAGSGEGSWYVKYIPVAVEIGLAHFVGTLIHRKQVYDNIIGQQLEAKLEPYDRALKEYRTNPDYLATLYLELRDWFIMRDRTLADDRERLEELIRDTYKLYTSDRAFSEWALKPEEVPDLFVIPKEAGTNTPTKRVPPMGAPSWTPQTLYNDLLAWGAPREFNRNDLLRVYADGYKVAEAWRLGAMKMFKEGIL